MVANGDAAITILFKDPLSERLSRQIHWLGKFCAQKLAERVTDIIPAYQSLTLCYCPCQRTQEHIQQVLQAVLADELPEDGHESRLITVPVCYDRDYGPDLASLAKDCGMTTEQVIALHSNADYLLHMLGFSPGFLYLGGLSSKLACARKPVPSARVAAGSVGIGGNQTGIYPQASPGGWHIIGRTPIALFNPHSSSPCVAQPLDKVRFKPITVQEFNALYEA